MPLTDPAAREPLKTTAYRMSAALLEALEAEAARRKMRPSELVRSVLGAFLRGELVQKARAK